MWPFRNKRNVYRKLKLRTDLYYGLCGVKYEFLLIKASYLNESRYFKLTKLPKYSVDIRSFTSKSDCLPIGSRVVNIDLVEIGSNEDTIRLDQATNKER